MTAFHRQMVMVTACCVAISTAAVLAAGSTGRMIIPEKEAKAQQLPGLTGQAPSTGAEPGPAVASAATGNQPGKTAGEATRLRTRTKAPARKAPDARPRPVPPPPDTGGKNDTVSHDNAATGNSSGGSGNVGQGHRHDTPSDPNQPPQPPDQPGTPAPQPEDNGTTLPDVLGLLPAVSDVLEQLPSDPLGAVSSGAGDVPPPLPGSAVAGDADLGGTAPTGGDLNAEGTIALLTANP